MSLNFIRDKIVVNAEFLAELNAEIAATNLPAYSTIFIAAREIKHAANYTLRLENYHLLIAADNYDFAGGAIDVSGRAGINGGAGPAGAKGSVSASGLNDKPGENGKPGGSGANGLGGMNVTLYVQNLHTAKIYSRGGNGGNGGAGGKGGDGGSGTKVVVDPEGGKYTELIGSDGGDGGSGGRAGNGATGGRITVVARQTNVSPVCVASGGAKGLGGAAGAGGKGGPYCKNGVNGTKGLDGANGAAGPISSRFVGVEEFWSSLRSVASNARVSAWAEYRVRAGEYFFRTYLPNIPAQQGNLGRAAHEFRSALRLHAATPRAQQWHDHILMNLNPLGWRRDYYLVPDFPQYEQAFVDYAPLVQNLIGCAKDMLVYSNAVQANKTRLSAQIAHIQSTAAIVQSELAEAMFAQSQAQGALTAANARIVGIEAEIAAKRAELTQARLELGSVFISSVFEAIGAVVAVVGAAYTFGASLAAVPGLLVAAQDKWGSLTKDSAGNLMVGTSYLTDLIQWHDESGKFSPKLKDEVKNLAGGLQKVVNSVQPAVNATIDLIDKGKVLGDLQRSTVDGELENELKRLLQRAAELAFEKAQSGIALQQAEMRVNTVQMKAAQADADLALAQQMLQGLTNDAKVVSRTAEMLVRRAKESMAHLAKFQFWATRAFEIYAHRDYSSQLPFDIGFIHPDEEEKSWSAFRRGDYSRALSLTEAYLNSWSRLPSLIVLRDEYETYRMTLLTQTQYWTLDEPQAWIQQFRETGQMEFDIPLASLLEGRFECKVEGAAIALPGAQVTNPMINTQLIHLGEVEVLRVDGNVETFHYPPRGCSLLAGTTFDSVASVPPSPPEAFWGRSPAARWRLVVEPQLLASGAVDLSAVTQVRIGLTYKAIIPHLSSNAQTSQAA